MHKGGYVYIVSNIQRTILYVGVTSDLREGIYQHREGQGSVFSKKYKCKYLVYYEVIGDITHAIEREKQLKNWHREWKLNLIRSFNPEMRDLFDEI
ncbi:GIY-YIG nuclease family protein [Pedobacter sp. SYSU D00535]|uniref:GIY-YIG nuclease family protein n=1 Tax=Pedobacter sp. SYSU D00535 TaxID=2810308 RepID=UPI001A9777BD|nr:GIY-YIG nuclease family protein [Pedobacter sp. SYSU D00535]